MGHHPAKSYRPDPMWAKAPKQRSGPAKPGGNRRASGLISGPNGPDKLKRLTAPLTRREPRSGERSGAADCWAAFPHLLTARRNMLGAKQCTVLDSRIQARPPLQRAVKLCASEVSMSAWVSNANEPASS